MRAQFFTGFNMPHLLKIVAIFLCALLITVRSLTPSFLTTLTDYKAGSSVLVISSPTTLNGYDTTLTTINFPSSFTQTPSVALGLSYQSSTYLTTTSLYTWVFDLSVYTSTSSSTIIQFNRTSSIFSQISINYIAVLNSSFLEITTNRLDLTLTTLYNTTSADPRTQAFNITYRTKSNSTNAIVVLSTIGLFTIKQTVHTYAYTLAISGRYTNFYEVSITVAGYNRLGLIRICGVSYEAIATTISPPYYLTIGYITDFSGTISDTSGVVGVTSTGTIFAGMTEWTIDDSNGVQNYNMSISSNSYVLTSTSLTNCRNAYVWYRQQTCPQYYYLTSHNCIACDISCKTCQGPLSNNCLTCTTTRTYNAIDKTCLCITGYVDLGARECTQVTCNNALCQTCAYIDQCGSCYSFLFRELNGTDCVCMKYRYDHYSVDSNPFCDSCHYSCYTCTSSAYNACTSCNTARDKREYKSANSTCVCMSGYYDSSTTICSKCNYTCSTCSLATSCTSCNITKGRVYDASVTYCTCTTGMYDDKLQQQCQSCMISCQTCSDAISCTTCPSTRTLTNTSTSNNQCTCMSGYYDTTTTQLCSSCQYSCYTCINPTQCQSCSSIMHRQYNSTTRLCGCMTGYYDDGRNQLCVGCYVMCLGCSMGGATACTSCDAGSYRVLALSGACVCMDGYYQYDNVTRLCATCNYTCAKCVNGYQCTSCNNLLHRITDPTNSSRCICTSGYYDTGNQLCSSCPYYCLTCTSSAGCATCDNTTRDITTNCTCRPGYYDDGTSTTCQPCLPQCITCTNPYNCTSCTPIIKYLTSTGRCKCSPGYLQPTCTSCAYQCQQCSGTSDNCVGCDGLSYRYYFWDNSTGKGDCLCYMGYYSDNASMLCRSCHYSCLTCTVSTVCTSCPINRQFDSNNQTCVCVSQYYQNNQSLNCLPCHYSCQNCSDYSQCTLCNSAKFRVLNVITKLCVCSAGYYDDGIYQLCKSCAPQCKTCSTYLTCLSCDLPTNHRVINNATQRCPCAQSYYQSTVNNTCLLCDPSCLVCIDGASCVACVSGRVIDVNTGLCRCADGTFENGTTLNCELCTYPCATCVGNSSTCLTCQSTHSLVASTYSCYCRAGTFENTTSCASCLPTCYQCSSNYSCTSCRASDNRNLQTISTQTQCLCILSYHDQSNTAITCTACNYTCLTCTNSQSCTSCKDIRRMLNSSSYCSCPTQRYYDDGVNSVCLPCSYLCLSCQGVSGNCTDCSGSGFRYKVVVDATTNSSTCLCLSKYYSAGIGIQACLPCTYSCSTCTNSTHCLTCNSTLFRILQPSTTTYCACTTGYYDVTNIQQCQPCSYTCRTCSQTSLNCLSCPTTRILTFNSCPCVAGMFDDMVSQNPTCVTCLYMCDTCSNSYSCLNCSSTRFLNSSSLCPCLAGYYDNGISNTCIQCNPTCKQCLDPTTCTSCYETTQLRQLYLSSCICQTRYYDDTLATPNSTNYICQVCHHSCQRCQNNLSCSSCDAGMFRVRDINTGYCKCADGYYDDGVNGLCLACAFDCLTCVDGVSCSSCPSQRTLDTVNTPNRCLCANSSYTNGSTCQSCPPECSSCTNYTTCTACNNPTQRSLVSGACICNTKLYPISNTALCGNCLTSCSQCVSNLYCTNCSSTAHRFLTARQCRCFTGFYDDFVNQGCLACHYSCLTCTNSTECLSCDTSSAINRVYNSSTKLCPCNVGFYEDPTSKICVACNYSCYSCSNPNSCSSCSPTTLRTLDSSSSQCLCPAIGYFDRLTPNCATCDPTCYTCTTSSTYCTSCNTNTTFRTLTPTHTCTCSTGYFQSPQTVICQTCSYKCQTCTTQSTQCTQCSSSDNRDNSTLPLCSCLQGFYDDGSTPACRLCDYRCLTCLDQFKCQTCDLGGHHRYMDLVSQMCRCADRYYQLSTSAALRDPVCQACLYSCLSCNHPTLCLTCDLTNNTRLFNNGQCLCSTGYYDDGSSLLCQPCRYVCQTCSSSSSCLTCNPLNNRVLNVTSGLCECLRGYYDAGNGVDSMCYPCHRSCYTCLNSTHCQTCPPLTNKYINTTEGTNYCICLYGYYQSLTTGICSRCHYSCEKCSGSAASCTVCDGAAHRGLVSGSCPCDSGYYDDGRNQMCLMCTSNCVSCFGVNAGQCLRCQNGTYLLNGVCWNTSCPDFYYQIPSTWSCESCLSYCQTCSTSTTCQQCQPGFYLISSNISNPNTTTLICTSPCPEFYYHNDTACMKCMQPCRHCSGLYVCLDCVQRYFFENSTGACYPCHSTCRYCTNSAAIGCISCIDGYFLNHTINLCTKLTCKPNQYVNSMYGCYNCLDTYPNSLQCTAYQITKCLDGYMLTPNSITNLNQCVRCDKITGYRYVASTGLCEEICGDGVRISSPCDDGNVWNGDGCSDICSIQQDWECSTSGLTGLSTCTLSALAQPSITVDGIKKISKQNKIQIVLVLNIGLRLVKQNFYLQFGRLQKFDYEISPLNSKYTRFKLTVQYFQSIAKQKLSISIKSPIPKSPRLLQSTSPTSSLTISLQLSVQLQITTQPPALYTSPQKQTTYTKTIYIILIVLHIATLIIFGYFILYLRLKIMLFGIQLINFVSLVYVYCTYGLFQVSEFVAESGRALQHFLYKFGDDLGEKYSGDLTSAGYFGFGGFILAGCIIQLTILGICLVIKVLLGGDNPNLSPSQRQSRKHKYGVFRYYQLSFLYAFVPDLLLCCVIVFKWIQINTSVQSAYSWGIAIVLLIIIMINNAMYISYAHPYSRIIQKSINKAVVNPLPFVAKEDEGLEQEVKVKAEPVVIQEQKKYQTSSHFVTLEQAIQEKNQQKQTKLNEVINNEFDPFAQETDKQKSQERQSQKSETSINKAKKSQNKMQDQQENLTQAIVLQKYSQKQEKDHQIMSTNKIHQKNENETASAVSIKSKSTTISEIKKLDLVNLYDLTPASVQNYSLDVNISYYRIILHESYLPFHSCVIPLVICIVAQVQESIPRCSMLIFVQFVVIVYLIVSMRLKNARTIKLLVMSLTLMAIASFGLAQAVIIQVNSTLSWSDETRKTIQDNSSLLEGLQIGVILFGIVFNIVLYILESVKSNEYRQYQIEKKNNEIIEKNIRKNRLRNINFDSPDKIKQQKTSHKFELKNIFSNMRSSEQQDYDRIQTKQHLRLDSQINTPAEYSNENTNSNILLAINTKKKNTDTIQIEDLNTEKQFVSLNDKVHKKLSSILDKNKDLYRTETNKKNKEARKRGDQKQLVINSLEQIQLQRQEANNLQSTRVNESVAQRAFSKVRRAQKQEAYDARNNNFMKMLENELSGENPNDTAIILSLDQKKQRINQTDRDNTLFSYKQSQKSIEAENKQQNQEELLPQKKKSSHSIIKDLIPTREYQQAREYKKEDLKRMVKQEQGEEFQNQDEDQGYGDQPSDSFDQNIFDEQDIYQGKKDNQKPEKKQNPSSKHYSYKIRGQKVKSKQKDVPIKIKSKQKQKRLKKPISSDLQFEQKKQKQTIKVENVELPLGIKNEGYEEKLIKPKKTKKQQSYNYSRKDTKISPQKQKKRRIERIDSISSISEDRDILEGQNIGKFEESDQESQQSEGVTVFKKILQDYQIYKNKKVEKYPFKRRP